jgi:hypothetical protein
MTPHPDMTVGVDDLLVERFHHCTACGRAAMWQDVRVFSHGAWAACVCRRCHRERGWDGVDQVLAARHGACSSRPGRV